MGEAPDTFAFGDLEAGFKAADLILDETILSQGTGHQPLETRTAMAYWQNGKLYLHGSTQSVAQTVPNIARMVGLKPEEVVLISEYTGGGFGSKIPGSHSMAIPALMAKKTGTPVMMRITARKSTTSAGPAPASRAAPGSASARTARSWRWTSSPSRTTAPTTRRATTARRDRWPRSTFQPEAYRWRGITVLTNTPPRTSQRSPGGMQMNAILDPIMAQAAKKLGIDHVQLLKINAPVGKAPYGPLNPQTNKQAYVTRPTSARRSTRAPRSSAGRPRRRSAARSAAPRCAASASRSAPTPPARSASTAWPIIRPDGKVQVQTGIGNLGTESVFDCQRVYAEVLDTPWEQFEIVWGNTERACRGPASRPAARRCTR